MQQLAKLPQRNVRVELVERKTRSKKVAKRLADDANVNGHQRTLIVACHLAITASSERGANPAITKTANVKNLRPSFHRLQRDQRQSCFAPGHVAPAVLFADGRDGVFALGARTLNVLCACLTPIPSLH